MRQKAPETFAERLAQLNELREAVVDHASEKAVEKQHAKGKYTARERIEKLLDPGSFQELDTYVRHRTTEFDMQKNRPWGDAVVTGHGTIDGRRVCVFSQDFTVFGGSLGEVMAEKMCKIMDLAAKIGCPVIGINDSGGARIQEGVVSLGAYGDVFLRNVRCSGVIPQISLIMGPCAGGAVYSPVFMVKETSHMFITGPDVIKTVTGEEVGFEELGGAMSHATKSGVAQFVSDDEDACLEDARYLLSFIPQNNLETAPRVQPSDDPQRMDEALDSVVPDNPNKPYDIRDAMRYVVDDGEFLEVHEHYAQNIVVGFSRLDGHAVGVVGNQPRAMAGVLDIDASAKAAAHLRRRARLPARHLAGVGRDHPPRREAALRLRRGDRPEDHDHHPQGLRRRLRRHELEAPGGGLQLRLAHGGDRGHGARGRGEHHPPPGHRDLADPRRAPREAHRRLQGPFRQPLHGGRARLRGRRDHPPRDAPEGDRGARGPAHQARAGPAPQARQHPAIGRTIAAAGFAGAMRGRLIDRCADL
jgi:acetyl-CoA carboxylase beta subunit